MKKISQETKKMFLFALFITSMVLVNILGSKITTILGIRISVGILFMPFLFLIPDMINEVYGRKVSYSFVQISTIMLTFYFLITWVCIALVPNPSWNLQAEYMAVFGSSLRMTAASIVGFLVSQNIDVFLFSVLKRLTKGKGLWIRKNLSTVVSQFADTTLFMFISFYRVNENFTAAYVFSLIIPYWAIKVLFAWLDTPLAYLGVKWLRSGGDAPRVDDSGNVIVE